jgi:hypothetical protein
MDGVFPFDNSNATLDAINGTHTTAKVLPPGTTITVCVYFYENIFDFCFNEAYSMQQYYSSAAAATSAVTAKLTIESITLSYESITLIPSKEIELQSDLGKGGILKYNFPCLTGSQRHRLASNVTYDRAQFPVDESIELFYIGFLNDWALSIDDTQHKPLSTFSRFPKNMTRMRITYAGNPCIVESFDYFGLTPDKDNHPSMINTYRYLQEKNIAPGPYESYFPRKNEPVNQYIVYDVKDRAPVRGHTSVIITMEFNGQRSPANVNVVFIPVSRKGEISYSRRNGWKNTTKLIP